VAIAPPATPKAVPVRKPLRLPTFLIHIEAGKVESAAPTTYPVTGKVASTLLPASAKPASPFSAISVTLLVKRSAWQQARRKTFRAAFSIGSILRGPWDADRRPRGPEGGGYRSFTALMSASAPIPRRIGNDTKWPRVVTLSSCTAKPTL
jgi:hypothetical protein